VVKPVNVRIIFWKKGHYDEKEVAIMAASFLFFEISFGKLS